MLSGAVAGEPFGAVLSFLYEDIHFLLAVLDANEQQQQKPSLLVPETERESFSTKL